MQTGAVFFIPTQTIWKKPFGFFAEAFIPGT
jgi:hypothetical protein